MTKIYKLTDIIINQPIINVGTIGHVAHGKTTCLAALTGVKTTKHSSEVERGGITIHLGYVNLYIYLNEEDGTLVPSSTKQNHLKLVKHISFVDCPGHKALMSTMISGSKIMNAAILLVAINDQIPQPQTKGHVDILQHTDISDVLILLNKIDLCRRKTDVIKKVSELETFIDENPCIQDKPIVPISAYRKINIEQICRFLCNLPTQDLEEKVHQEFSMTIVRSFDVNKINVTVDKLQGGVIGGSIQSGFIEINDYVMILPGLIETTSKCRPIFSQIKSIRSDINQLDIAFPGGLVALGLDIDPALCKQNNFLGNTIIKLNQKNFHQEKNITTQATFNMTYLTEVKNLSKITVVINSKAIKATVIKMKQQYLEVKFEMPVVLSTSEQYSFLTDNLFGIGKVKKINRNVEIIMPSGIDEFYHTLPETSKDVQIVNDLPDINFDTAQYNLSNITQNIIPHMMQTQQISIPEPIVEKETTRFIWTNFHLFNRILHIETVEKIYELKDLFPGYIKYVYNIEQDTVASTSDQLTVQIKNPRSLKQKPETVIMNFFKKYYYCSACLTYNCRIQKISSKFIQKCFHCSTNTMINEPWL